MIVRVILRITYSYLSQLQLNDIAEKGTVQSGSSSKVHPMVDDERKILAMMNKISEQINQEQKKGEKVVITEIP